MASYIGIKIANGEFYPILEDGSSVRKRLILTTVHDGQRSVQIDLYKSVARSMADAAYIGSLVVENIAPKPKGDPSIELVIASVGDDEIEAEAADLDSPEGGERHHLSVSLQALDEQSTYEVPDFELEQNEAPPEGLYEKASAVVEREEGKKSFPTLAVLIAILALIVIAAALWFFLLRKPQGAASAKAPSTETQAAPAPAKSENAPAAAPAAPAPVQAAPEPAKQESVAAPAPVQKIPDAPAPAASSRRRPPAPVHSYNVPRTIPPEGARYRIRWGDTLWDISEAFYRNPWLYPRIARFNNIRNPDLIISGTTIRIPPRN